MSQISTKPPSGMRDFLAPDVARRRHVVAVVQDVYESFGFVPLETPTIENLSTLLGKYGPEGDQLLYRLLHRREKLQRALGGGALAEADLADEGLRYDLTVPLARVVANYRDLPAFYKRYQIQPVWRADRPGRGRFREFYQCDVDITGTKSLLAEAEVCGAVATVLRRLGFEDFQILVNHRQVLRGLVAKVTDVAHEGRVLTSLDKLDKIGAGAVIAEMVAGGVAEAAAAQVLAIIEGLKRADGGVPEADFAPEAFAALRELFAMADAGPAGGHIRFEPTLARGLSYYTGPIFEIAVPGLAGSCGGGGRYDELIGMFLGKQVPAVGFSLGLERILLVMEERKMFPELAAGPEVLLCRFPDVPASEAVRVASLLRAAGRRVEVYPDPDKLGKQLGYATTVGARFAAILGRAELDAGTLTVKHLEKGEQRAVPIAEAAATLATWA